MKAAIYARVSTLDQEPENQLQELRRYVEARGWTAQEYVDHGVSGTKDRRPALDRLVADARRRKLDTVVVWRLDRLGRSLKHLVTLLDELQSYGVGFAATSQGINTTDAAGRMLLGFLAVVSEFERSLIIERTRAGLERARSKGIRLGRPPAEVDLDRLVSLRRRGLSQRAIAARLGIGRGTVQKALRQVAEKPLLQNAPKSGNPNGRNGQ